MIPKFVYALSVDLPVGPAVVASLAILKKPQPLDVGLRLSGQLQVVNLPGYNFSRGSSEHSQLSDSPFELLHSVVHSALGPYFDAYTKSHDVETNQRSLSEAEQRVGLPSAKKKMADFELSLLQLQHNVEIPQLSLEFHPVIASVVDDATRRGNKPTIDDVPRTLIGDTNFHNSLTAGVNAWTKAIFAVTKATRDPTAGTATQEVKFWLDMESALENAEKMMRSDNVVLTIDVLREAKRYAVTTSFRTDTGLTEAKELVQSYNLLMRDFPLDDLLAAPTLDRVLESLKAIFNHMNKRLRTSEYPVQRALPLAEAISTDLDRRLHRILDGRKLMQMQYAEFKDVMDQLNLIWEAWDEDTKEFTTVIRDLIRKRAERGSRKTTVTSHQAQTQDRLRYIATFRGNHEQLQRTIHNVLSAEGRRKAFDADEIDQASVSNNTIDEADAIREIAEAYDAVKDVNVLDLSATGTMVWDRAESLYGERTSRVENSIIASLRDQLATAKTANEMFRVFSSFNALFVRPKIRGAISEYQVQLLDSVKQDIAMLHQRFNQQYGHSQSHALAQLHDMPPLSGSIIWTRQIERQLDGYMKRVEDVLGSQWYLHVDGQKLRSQSNDFKKALDTKPIFQSWLEDVSSRDMSVSGRLFNINRIRASGNSLELSINFDAHIIALFKEVRNLTWLGFTVPYAVGSAAKGGKRVYPYAVSLMESIRTFGQTVEVISNVSKMSMLLNGYVSEAHSFISKGLPLKWESFAQAPDLPISQDSGSVDTPEGNADNVRNNSKHALFAKDFALSMSVLQDKTTTLASMHEIVETTISIMRTSPFEFEAFQHDLGVLQSTVDKLVLEGYVNVEIWVANMNAVLVNLLLERLTKALDVWIAAFGSKLSNPQDTDDNSLLIDGFAHREGHAVPIFEPLVHEVVTRYNTIYLDPPLEIARQSWLAQMHDWIGRVCGLVKLRATRHNPGLYEEISFNSFDELLPLCIERVASAYDAIDFEVERVSAYVDEWLQFQSLWDLQIETVVAALGDDLKNWLQLLQELRQTRSTFDRSASSKVFGCLVIEYGQVQSKITTKYDSWQAIILTRFARKLQSRVSDRFADITKLRSELEGSSLEAATTARAVSFITIVQSAKRDVLAWHPEIDMFRQGQSALSRYRYAYPQDWIAVEQIEHDWTALNEILGRKNKIVLEQMDVLRRRVVAEERIMDEKIDAVASEWTKQKPISGTIPVDKAITSLRDFEGRVSSLNKDAELLAKAKEALDLPLSNIAELDVLLVEIHDFQSVWAGLATVWNALDDLRETPWTTTQPRKIRQSLDNLVALSREMPSRMRQYAAFEHLQNVLQQLLRANAVLIELRSEALKERHWIRIFKTLKPDARYSQLSMTLGDVWDLQLVQSQAALRGVLVQARGEMALEEYLKQVRETWQQYSLDLVNYRNKCRLIRGFDDLFTKCNDNLNALQAMRHSPYYKEFEDEASTWEERLSRLFVIFDTWIDVQRQWTYLEGLFSDNADIKHLLPIESSRFANINSEFFALMKKVQRGPDVLDVIAIPGVQKSLERLADLLQKIQKALGEYLEKERASFPRFYFVGDEDLLEMIGNSQDINRVARHLGKMFSGISGLISTDSDITGFSSRQGEMVSLGQVITLEKGARVNDWLGKLERAMKQTLASLLGEAVLEFPLIFNNNILDPTALEMIMAKYPAQIVVLAGQVWWTTSVDAALHSSEPHLSVLRDLHVQFLTRVAEFVVQDLDPILRKKCEHLITEFVFQRDVLERLEENNVRSSTHYLWLLQMRYVYDPTKDLLDRLCIEMADARLEYGFEYLGVNEKLVRTPLTDRCFLTMAQAINQRLGGSPYGPAGTGKTETVKALGSQLGRFTIVFNCDDTFDFQAMSRIFLGICQVGAWGCFDEFNRLEERILSAVSQQIQNIQVGMRAALLDNKIHVELAGRQIRIHPSSGLFITMNPGYAGRSNLPDNLKKLFRSVAMSKPDKELIAEVILYSQGFSRARDLSKQIVPFFDSCSLRLSDQAHYDFGLRALKSVLVSSGGLKRSLAMHSSADITGEAQLVLRSLRETIGPKLLRDDIAKMHEIEAEVFPGIRYTPASLNELKNAMAQIMEEKKLTSDENWVMKAIQLFQIQELHHGVMMVGTSGSGKSATWSTLLEALHRVEGTEGVAHIIDPKVMSKETLYGSLDSTTREWTDGLFTSTLRRIIDNLRGEDAKRHWIVFDGDVDPDWVETLNSVLDDNKLLTLPNGERLVLPPNVRILFEVETLKYATPATVSRCGMVWFNEDNVTSEMLVDAYIQRVGSVALRDSDLESSTDARLESGDMSTQAVIAEHLRSRLRNGTFITDILLSSPNFPHIMAFTPLRAFNTLFPLLDGACKSILQYNADHVDFPMDVQQIENFMSKKLLLALTWSFTGDCPLATRHDFANTLSERFHIDSPDAGDSGSLIDFKVTLPDASWTEWQKEVPIVDIDTASITQTDVVIPTLDTVRHEDIFYSWLSEHRPLILCGPPGSGKTMTLFNSLRKLPDMEVVGLNFSSATTPDLLLRSFEQHCEYRKTLSGITLSPQQLGRWLVLFCDEINLPAPDKYGTQRVISFLRQLVERNGFWRPSDRAWVTLERVQFVGACNPPTDAGRVPLSLRFLGHVPLVMVDYPGHISLLQIYSTFNNAVLKVIPSLRAFSEPLTHSMIQLYAESQHRFTTEIQPHYIYSPRELTRWVKGIFEAIKPLEVLDLDGLVRIWAHEAYRLFQDRLIGEDERDWTAQAINRIALEYFPTIDSTRALGGPILFSNWLSRHCVPVKRDELRDFVKARLRTFCEEEVDVQLILYDDALDHVLRIDRVFRQPQGHVILIGVSGSGKTTLSRFVAWMNGLKVFQIKVHRKYSSDDFDDDLRELLRRCGCRGERICFIMDEANVLDSAFLERMNTLLANAEVPGLFEGDDYTTLMTACKEGSQRQGLILDSQEELYKWFTQQIVRNLHVVFTMNPPEGGLASRAATSPALFNRCVLNWFGDWSNETLFQVGSELTQSIDLSSTGYIAPEAFSSTYSDLSFPPSQRQAVVNTMVHIHQSMHAVVLRQQRQQGRTTFLTPRHFLDFVAQFDSLLNEKHSDLEDQQRHLNVGVDKLRETVDKVRDLRRTLASKKQELELKDKEASEKLERMILNQQQAEKSKAISLELRVAIEKKDKEVAARKQVVAADLAKAEPAVKEAAKSVNNIKRQHLTEVRSLPSPPTPIKLALESVCVLLGHKVDNWKAIQAIVRRDDFIASIVNYDSETQMTPSYRRKMRNEYLSQDDFSYQRVNYASKACGPLVQWVEAQVTYSEILDRVGPLREEAERLSDEALQAKLEAQIVEKKIAELETNIATYKRDYAGLVSQTEAIKTEMSYVEKKVTRSLHLLDSLASERKRWEEGSKGFDSQIETIVGDVITASAFITYGGLFDQQYRKAMLEDWLHHCSLAGLQHKAHNSVGDYLSTADERLQWQAQGLPVDELCTENAIILNRFNRYPLIIDPSGTVTQFLQNQHRDRRLTVTSFLDSNFSKQVESALRFGNPILIQDAEYLDPLLNHVLNREYQKVGGRTLVQLGKQEIDFSPTFKLYLSTRDPSAMFAPDVCSRTTFVNFTITQSSLTTQTLSKVLRSERPDVDERRINLIKMQGDFKVDLRRLEQRLLKALNESQGNILDNDAVIDTLETVKAEVAVITTKVAETEGVMVEVEKITTQYRVVASSCSAIFAVLEQLKHINNFYQFSLQFFVEVFDCVLDTTRKSLETTDAKTRVAQIVKSLFVETYHRTSLALLQKDQITFGLLLAQAAPYSLDSSLFNALMDASYGFADVSSSQNRPAILATVQELPLFSQSQRTVEAWDSFIDQESSELHAFTTQPNGTKATNEQLLGLTATKMLRADRLLPTVEYFLTSVFGDDLFNLDDDLAALVDRVDASTPIALCCSPGFDASFKVDNAVSGRGIKCLNVALGSAEAQSNADKAITEAATTGTWVFIKNVHLGVPWLQSLEKKLNSLRPNASFRLFLSMETSLKIPVNILRLSRVVMCEQPAGIKANMRDTFIPSIAKATQPPVERSRLYLLLSLLHGTIQERIRYAPTLGWTATWEFNDSDFDCAAHVLNTWTDRVSQGRTNIDPGNIPWDMIRSLLVITYGGKIDSEQDYERLRDLVDALITPATFDNDFDVVQAVFDASTPKGLSDEGNVARLALPTATSWDGFKAWIMGLPEREPPSYLGLPADAEKMLLIEQGKSMISNMAKVMKMLDESEQVMAEADIVEIE